MFCPNCELEYRQGFTRCADCDVELVPALPQANTSAKGDLQPVWESGDEQECVKVCQALRKAGIGYEVARKEASRWMKLNVTWRYEINVAADDYDNAKEIAEALASPEIDEEEGQAETPELPDNESEDSADDMRAASYTAEWYPEDATAEICEEKKEALCSMIEASLAENSIHFRADEARNGAKKYFVLPENERKAREIVREILSAAPEE